jgi:hypothetical protein
MKKAFAIFAVMVVLLLSGCASVQMASVEQDSKAKMFAPAPGKASLYIYRNETFGAAVPMAVSLNGKTLGQTAAKTYFHLNLNPGKYNVESTAENVSNITVATEAGKNYFVWQEVKMGMWMARSLLHEVDERTGRAGVAESKMIALPLSFVDMAATDMSPAMRAPSTAPSSDAVAQKLRELQNLRKDGVITEDEFQKKKEQLLQQL